MPTGTVTRVFETKGFGYITPDEGDRDLLVRVDAQMLWQFTKVCRAQSISNETQSDSHRPIAAFGTRRTLSALPKLREGTRVQFEIEDSDVGLQAVAVAPLR